MCAVYLTGETLYLRAMVAGDREHTAAWFAGPFPMSPDRADRWLKEAHQNADRPGTIHLVVVRAADDAVIGGAIVRTDYRKARLVPHIDPLLPDADALRGAALRVLHPWLRDDLDLMAFVLPIPEDQPETIAAAEALGMIQSVRYREAIARPGHRVDELLYQARFAPWTAGDA